MDTLSFINECFEKIGIAPAEATSCEIPAGDVPAEFGNLIVTLYRYGVAYDLDIDRDEIKLFTPLGIPYTFSLTPLDWWAGFREWLAAETAEIIGASA